MKRYLRIVLIALCSALILGFVGYSYNLSQIQMKFADSGAGGGEPLKYHFVVIGQDMGDVFWQSLKEGAQKAGEEYSAAIEFNGPMIQDVEAELDYMEIAIASRVDGIIVYVTDPDRFTPLINKAVSLGIHVITIESDDKDSNRDAFVGPNSYTAGLSQGNLVVEAMNGSANVAIIIGGNYAGNADAKESLLRGFHDSVSGHANVRLVTEKDSSTGYFGAETAIREILNQYPHVNTVVCTSSDDTLEVVHVLIDLNRDNDITVIGYSNSPQIRDYIRKNNIYGSVYEDPKETGYQSVASLVRILNGQKPPGASNTGVYTITRSNLVSYHGS
jgi:ribose transport system substrate-binding protein